MSEDNDGKSTITVRVIRSLEHKNWRPLVIRKCDLDHWTLSHLRKVIEERMRDPSSGLPPPFTRDLAYYDSVKLETDPKANNAKSSNALINTTTSLMSFKNGEEGMDRSLSTLSLSHECEISLFNRMDYENYLSNHEH